MAIGPYEAKVLSVQQRRVGQVLPDDVREIRNPKSEISMKCKCRVSVGVTARGDLERPMAAVILLV